MANNKKPEKFDEKIEQRREEIVDSITSTEAFYKQHKGLILGAIAAVVVIAAAVFAYYKFGYQSKVDEAAEQSYTAEILFRNGEYELALNGDGNNLGFADIIDTYGNKAGKAMNLYAGVCELQLGNYEGALDYLKKYKGKEPILAARAKACEGDAYVGLGEYSKAVDCYNAAVKKADNIFAATYLLKAGLAYEAMGDNAAALACYESIRDNYPQSIEAYDINKYIARVIAQ